MKNIINTLQSGLSLKGFGAFASFLFPFFEEINCMQNNCCADMATGCCCECCCC